jgi:hypothetical protein
VNVGLCTYILKELSVGLGQFGVGYFFNRKLNCVVGVGLLFTKVACVKNAWRSWSNGQ